jgi:small subunit ribosomal protein S3
LGQKVHPYGFRLGTLYGWQSNWFAGKHYAEQLHEDVAVRNFLKKKLFHAGISKVLRAELKDFTSRDVFINVKEIRKAELDAQLVAENIALQLERRVAFRRAMKKAMISTMKFGAEGIRLQCSGRLGGSEMGRREWYRDGRVPLHTLRADIEYGFAQAKTTYGIIGVKCWVFKGEVGDKDLHKGPLGQHLQADPAR